MAENEPEIPEACQSFLRRVHTMGDRRILAAFAGPEEEWPLIWLRDWPPLPARRAAEAAFDRFAGEVGGPEARAAVRSFIRYLLE